MKPGRAWIVLVALAALLVVAMAIRSASDPAAVERADLSFTLKDMNGQDVALSDFAGKPLVVNLWATWCAPCRTEMPQLVELSEKYKARGVAIIGISIDDSPEEIRAFAKQFDVPYPTARRRRARRRALVDGILRRAADVDLHPRRRHRLASHGRRGDDEHVGTTDRGIILMTADRPQASGASRRGRARGGGAPRARGD